MHGRTALAVAMLRGDRESMQRLHAAGAKQPPTIAASSVTASMATMAGSVAKGVPMIRVPDVARHVGLSATALAHAYSPLAGESPLRTIQRLKIDAAKRLHQAPDVSADAEIPYAAGIDDDVRHSMSARARVSNRRVGTVG